MNAAHSMVTLSGRGMKVLLPLLVLLLMASCSLFEPRDGELPLDEGEIDWRPPLSPGAVIHNLDQVLLNLDRLRYDEVLTDSSWASPFQHLGDRENQGNGLPTDWGREEELLWWQRFCDQFRQAGLEPDFALLRVDSSQTADSASFTIDYAIDVPGSGAIDSYSGQLRLSLSRHLQTGDWGLHRWEDMGSDTSRSWTTLKQDYLWQ